MPNPAPIAPSTNNTAHPPTSHQIQLRERRGGGRCAAPAATDTHWAPSQRQSPSGDSCPGWTVGSVDTAASYGHARRASCASTPRFRYHPSTEAGDLPSPTEHSSTGYGKADGLGYPFYFCLEDEDNTEFGRGKVSSRLRS